MKYILSSCLSMLVLLSKPEVTTSEERYVEYSLWWITSRARFGWPAHFRRVRIFFLDEWDSFEREWYQAWYLVKGANYEVPLYLINKNYIPNPFRDYCTPSTTSAGDDFMLLDFTEDDRVQSTTVRDLVSPVNSYWFGDWLHLFVFFYNLCYCMRGELTARTCPNGCWRPNVCQDDPNSLHICRPIHDKSVSERLHPSRKQRFGEMYSAGFECVCRLGFRYCQKRKKCIVEKVSCNDKRYGKTPCRNKGTCYPLNSVQRPLPSITFKCNCPPAWQGYVCQKPRNPCQYDKNLCGVFPCQRDPSNEVFGFSCICSLGYAPTSQIDTTCVNVDECKQSLPCMNGGTCVDLTPPTIIATTNEELRFRCECRLGFSGTLCEKPPSQIFWSSWTPWTACSVSCGIGSRSRSRACPRPGECVGRNVQTGICSGILLSCDEAKLELVDGKLKLSHQSIFMRLKQAGVLWSSENENELSDAFTWSEQQYNVPIRDTDSSESGKSIAVWIGDITNWLGLCGITQRWTYKQLSVLLGSIAGSLLLTFIGIFFGLRACKPINND